MSQRLWEVSHPYTIPQGNHFDPECHIHYESWDSFLDTEGNADFDMNLVYRWDWNESSDGDKLVLFYMGQRKVISRSIEVSVTKNDEPAVREWLTVRADQFRELWSPLFTSDDVHLWEVKHAYYASEGNYFRGGYHDAFRSWDDFLFIRANSDLDDNFVYRWDWFTPESGFYRTVELSYYGEDAPSDRLFLFYMNQNEAIPYSVEIAVSAQDEPAVRAWLAARAQQVKDVWEPLI